MDYLIEKSNTNYLTTIIFITICTRIGSYNANDFTIVDRAILL